MKYLHFAAAAFAVMLGALPAAAAALPDYVAKAVADPARSKGATDRDASRLPGETIAFAGVKPGMTVAEFFPGGGYFTRMLSNVVGPKGHIYSIENAKWDDGSDAKLIAMLPNHNAEVQIGKFGEFTLPQKVDLVWITQNYHDLHIAKYGPVDMAAFNKHVFASLKPGGTYFILDHQANPGVTEDDIAKLHRIPKSEVIKEVEAAGFKLVAEGGALNRPADDHTRTIFDKAIQGHTDQYMLRFVKP